MTIQIPTATDEIVKCRCCRQATFYIYSYCPICFRAYTGVDMKHDYTWFVILGADHLATTKLEADNHEK